MQQNDLTALSKWLESASLEQSIYDGPEADNLRAAARCVGDSAELLGVLKLMFDSAYPHPIEHPTMFQAWGEARILLIRHGAIKPSNPEDSI